MHVFGIAKTEGPVGEGVTGSQWVSLPAIAKSNVLVDTCVVNEYIAGHLGRFIGLPMAPGAIISLSSSPKTYGYASLKFNLTQESLPDVIPELVASKMPRLAMGLVVFDILIANPDRHAGNLSALVHGDTPELLVFDHSHALLGHDLENAVSRLSLLRNRLGISGGSATQQNRHCLLDHIGDESLFNGWISRVKALPDYLIDDLCRDVRELGLISTVQSSCLSDFLKHRRNQIEVIISKNKDEFRGITQWGLQL